VPENAAILRHERCDDFPAEEVDVETLADGS